MDLKGAKKHIEKNVNALEIQIYNFQTVAIPRAEQDKRILSEMKQQLLRLDAIEQKQERGEEISTEEAISAIPEVFR